MGIIYIMIPACVYQKMFTTSQMSILHHCTLLFSNLLFDFLLQAYVYTYTL